jgi:hypothetical protein
MFLFYIIITVWNIVISNPSYTVALWNSLENFNLAKDFHGFSQSMYFMGDCLMKLPLVLPSTSFPIHSQPTILNNSMF